MLPRVKIAYLNGQLGAVGDSPDGLFALICGAIAAAGTFALQQAYSIRSMDDLADLGVTAENNAHLYRYVKQFYDEAEEGTELIIYGVSPTAKMTALLDQTSGSVRELISAQNGRLRGLFVAGADTTSGTATEGLDPDVLAALPIAQQLAEWATEELYAPLFVILEGYGYTGENMRDLSALAYNRVGILVGDTEPGNRACLGTLAGRLAGVPVQRNAGRVKDGALFPTEMYVGSTKVDESSSVIAALYDKGYITPRKYVGRTGYFFTDDRLACDETDDYAHIAHRRVIDKAYRITYDTLLDMLLDELEVNEDGTLQAGIVKNWQQTVEDQLNARMTANGELSAGDDGAGCVCYIDQTQNVLATSKVLVTVQVRPFGYARYVDVSLGFQVTRSTATT